MMHQGRDLQLTAYAARDWRANFFPTGIAHSILSGTGWEPALGGRCSGRRLEMPVEQPHYRYDWPFTNAALTADQSVTG
jgi:hypothetical protein